MVTAIQPTEMTLELSNEPTGFVFRGRTSDVTENRNWAWFIRKVAATLEETETSQTERLEAERYSHFRDLADVWHLETGHLSSPDRIAAHPAYRKIVDLGRLDKEPVLQYIFGDLQARGGFWFAALRELTNQSPVPTEHRGKMGLVKEDWLRWAREHDYIR